MNRICLLLICFVMGFAPFASHAHDGDEATGRPADKRQPMILGAASNFSQGWRDVTFDAARDLPLRHYRDGLRWRNVEREPGVYRFNNARLNYPGKIGDDGAELVLTLNWGNPLYDNGNTPYSSIALAAFGRFAAAVVQRYPAITALEIGNEFNGQNFVNGPVRKAGLAERGRYHLAMVRAAAEAVRAVRPDIRVIGGSTHSIAAGYLWPILEQGGAPMLDGLAIHPYTTPIDQFAAQFGVLRRNALAADMPIEITEWGSQNRERAADDLVRGYVALAALGMQSLYWYPLNERGDGHIPLVRRNGTITSAGEAYRFVQAHLAQHPARDISPDDFTFVYSFGPRIMVLWGEPRGLALSDTGIAAYDARGRQLDNAGLRLSADQPITLIGDQPLLLGENIQLDCQTLLADTFYQFTYPPGQSAGFQPSILTGGQAQQWHTLPGQQRGGVPWTPYLGHPQRRGLRLTAENMLLPGRGGSDYTIVHDYIAPQDGEVRLEASFDVSERSADGIMLTITVGERDLLMQQQSGQITFDKHVVLAAGENLRIAVGSGADRSGDAATYRLRLHKSKACPAQNRLN